MLKLELPVHPQLETILGYSGKAPKVLFYLEADWDKVIYSDGLDAGSANTWAFWLWQTHPSVKGKGLELADGKLLLLDRQCRELYVIDRDEAIKEMAVQVHPSPPDPFDLEDLPKPGQAWEKAQQLMQDFVIWLGSQQRQVVGL